MKHKQNYYDLSIAIRKHDLNKVSDLLSYDSELLLQMTPFGSWLHIAASAGNFEIVKLLVKLGLDVNQKGGTFNAGAINRAASEGHYEIVKYLLSLGAELETGEPDQNPLFAAIYGGNKDIVQLLIDSGIDTMVRYTGEYMKDMDAYDFAVERGQLEIAEVLKNLR